MVCHTPTLPSECPDADNAAPFSSMMTMVPPVNHARYLANLPFTAMPATRSIIEIAKVVCILVDGLRRFRLRMHAQCEDNYNLHPSIIHSPTPPLTLFALVHSVPPSSALDV